MKPILSTVLFLAILLFASCKHDSDKEQQRKQQVDTATEKKVVVFPIPTPYSVTSVLKATGAEFYEYLLNPVSNAEAYITVEKQGLNLGVYATDLSYANVYANSQLVNEYFSVVKYLTEDLGFTNLFDKKFLLRIQNNIDKPDSLFVIATEVSYKTYEYLVNRGKGDLATVVLAGTWIEALFLATQIGNITGKPQLVWQEIAQQKFSSQVLTEKLEQFRRSSDFVDGTYQDMKKLDILLRRVKFKNDTAIYDPQLFDELSSTVANIRSNIVRP